MSNILMIIPPERFRDEELFATKDELEKLEHKVTIASTKKGVCPGSRGGFAESKYDINELNTDKFEVVIFVGGGGSKLLFKNVRAYQIANEMNAKGKIVAAICLAPVILANAGILKHKKATVSGTEAKTIEEKGAEYTGPGVTVDGNIVTANAPKQSKLFGQTIGKLLIDKF